MHGPPEFAAVLADDSPSQQRAIIKYIHTHIEEEEVKEVQIGWKEVT